ncbi:MAG: phosphatase PAP2 family protein [Alphaproteobacteria bacterium]|nr:phosphatase PAP2 family protein [Alphaproteobacteria bacterium]
MQKPSESGLAWVLLAVLALADAAGVALTGIEVRIVPCVLVAAIVLLLTSFSYVSARKSNIRIAALALTIAQGLAYAALVGTLSYLLAADRRPLIDARLVSVDRALGIDWMAIYLKGETYAYVRRLLECAYYSLIPQFFLIQFVLIFKGRFDWGRELFWLFVIVGLACVLVGGAFPAAGAFVTFNVPVDDVYIRHFLALRDGTMKVIDLSEMTGVVQFPSFHLAMAGVLTYASRGIRLLFPFSVAWNLLMVAATPFIGGHYFADLCGGAVVTLCAVAGIRLFRRLWLLRRRAFEGQ